MSNPLRWVSLTHILCLHANYGSAGEWHIYQRRFKSFPIHNDQRIMNV
tara:strand:- start:1827 stop:1970 length:144 start_codon:yes stop_codon:yes gene_type:complete